MSQVRPLWGRKGAGWQGMMHEHGQTMDQDGGDGNEVRLIMAMVTSIRYARKSYPSRIRRNTTVEATRSDTLRMMHPFLVCRFSHFVLYCVHPILYIFIISKQYHLESSDTPPGGIEQ
jgi:hypothetical protein